MASEKALRAIGRVGQSVNLAMERFVAVADKIGDDNPDIKQDMYEACKEARTAGECALVRRVGKLGFSLWLPMLLKVSGPYEACPQGSRRG